MKQFLRYSRVIAMILVLAQVFSMCAFAELVSAQEVTYYTRPDHWYTDLSEYSSRVYYDLAYCGENSTESEILHLVLPDDAEGPYPVLVYVHGGALLSLNSSDHMCAYTVEAALHALKDGYAVACVDYTLTDPEQGINAIPTAIYEVKAAIRFLRSIADEYNLDAERVALIGESAGGYLVDIVGTTNGEAAYDYEPFGNMEYSSDVQAVIGQYSLALLDEIAISVFCGIDPSTMSAEELQEFNEFASAIYHVDENDPPFYLQHGLTDSEVPYTQSCDFFNALEMAGVENCELTLYSGMEHAVSWFQSEENAEGYMAWLNRLFEK